MSYFLGMTQTQLSCHEVLGIPTLVHLDAFLRAIGKATTKSRPDFLGYDPLTGAAVAVEAKGRTNQYDHELIGNAKGQAQKLPGIAGFSSTAVASIAYFNSDRVWHSLLIDPPRRHVTEFKASAVLAAHYLPVVRAAAVSDTTSREGSRLKFEVPSVDLTVSLPGTIFEVLHRGDESWTEATLASAGDQIIAWMETDDRAALHRERVRLGDGLHTELEYIGGDMVGVHLGDSWGEG